MDVARRSIQHTTRVDPLLPMAPNDGGQGHPLDQRTTPHAAPAPTATVVVWHQGSTLTSPSPSPPFGRRSKKNGAKAPAPPPTKSSTKQNQPVFKLGAQIRTQLSADQESADSLRSPTKSEESGHMAVSCASLADSAGPAIAVSTDRGNTAADAARERAVSQAVVRELRDLAAIAYRTSGSFYFAPINEAEEAVEHSRMAIEVAMAAVAAVPRSTGTPDLSLAEAAERTAEAISSIDGAATYPWQDPPLYKAVLESRRDELRETGLSVHDGTLAEWNALVAVLDASLRVHVASLSKPQPQQQSRKRWVWRSRHSRRRKMSYAPSTPQTAKSHAIQPVLAQPETAVLSQSPPEPDSHQTNQATLDVPDTDAFERTLSAERMVKDGWMDAEPGVCIGEIETPPRSPAVLSPLGAGSFGPLSPDGFQREFSSLGGPLSSPPAGLSPARGHFKDTTQCTSQSAGSASRSRTELRRSSAFRRTGAADSVRRSFERLITAAERADIAGHEALFFQPVDAKIDQLAQLELRIERALSAAEQLVTLQRVLRGYQLWHALRNYKENLATILRSKTDVSGKYLKTLHVVCEREVRGIQTLVGDCDDSVNSTLEQTEEVLALEELYARAEQASISSEIPTLETRDFLDTTTDQRNWIRETRNVSTTLVATTRHRLVSERLRLTVSRSALKESAQSRHWREVVFGVKGAISAAEETCSQLDEMLTEIQDRFPACFSLCRLQKPRKNSGLGTSIPSVAASRKAPIQMIKDFWQMCRQIDTEAVSRLWDAKCADLTLKFELQVKEEKLELLRLAVENQRYETTSTPADFDPAVTHGSEQGVEDTCCDNTHVQEDLLKLAFKKKLLHTSKSAKRQQTLQDTLDVRQHYYQALDITWIEFEKKWQGYLDSDLGNSPFTVAGSSHPDVCSLSRYDLVTLDATIRGKNAASAWCVGSTWCDVPAGLLISNAFTTLSALRRGAWEESWLQVINHVSESSSGSVDFISLCSTEFLPTESMADEFLIWFQQLSRCNAQSTPALLSRVNISWVLKELDTSEPGVLQEKILRDTVAQHATRFYLATELAAFDS